MRKTFYTPEGVVERELTDAEVQALAKMGDPEAMREVFKKLWAQADTDTKKMVLIKKYIVGDF